MTHAARPMVSAPYSFERGRRSASLGNWTARRLALFRKCLAAAMIITGAPVVALYRSESAGVRHVLIVLAVLWLSMLLPMVRLLCLEWQHRRVLEAIHPADWRR